MKELLISALLNAHTLLLKQVPLTKKKLIEVGIHDVKPLELVKFMDDNNIPNDAWFGGKDNGYDAFSEVCLCYHVDIPTTEKDKMEFRRKRFDGIAWKFIYELLLANGYKRISSYSNLFKEFDDTTIYDMYINKDFDRLVKRYSLQFAIQ